MMYEPIYSPWGKVQNCEELCPGIYSVSTASHGGIMAVKDVATTVLSENAQKCGFWDGRFLCFEEDCDAPVAIRELLDKNLYAAPVNEHWKPGEYSACIDGSLQRHHPDYWTAYTQSADKGSKDDNQRQHSRKERER